MMMMCFGGMSIVAVLWAVFGYSMVFGNSVGGAGLIGNITEYFGMEQLLSEDPNAAIPAALFAAFQLFFAGITTAIIAGAAAGRMKFGAWMTFAALWATLVYFPVAHWVFAFTSADGSVTGGWIVNNLKAIDFAGGTAVDMNAGIAALALALVLGRSAGWPRANTPNPTQAAGTGRRRTPVGRLVRLQRRLGAHGRAVASWCSLDPPSPLSGLLAWPSWNASGSAAPAAWRRLRPDLRACRHHPRVRGSFSPLGALAIGVIAGAVCSWPSN